MSSQLKGAMVACRKQLEDPGNWSFSRLFLDLAALLMQKIG